MEGDGGGMLNPFLNHLIINKTLSCISRISDLKSLRLVSSHWNALTLPKLMKSSIVNIKSQKDTEHYLSHFKCSVPHRNFHWKGTGIDLKDPLLKTVLASCEELHFSKGLITLDDLLEILKRGQNLRTLSFNEVSVDQTPSEDKEVVDSRETKEENELSSLRISRLEVTSCDEEDNFPWNIVLPKVPHLQVLHAQLQSTSQVTCLLESMLAHQVKLEEFSCFLVDMNEEHLHLLACLEMSLRVLDISLASTVASPVVQNFLSTKSCQKLENVKLFKEADCGHKNYFALPRLPGLKSLEILGDPVAKIFTTISSSCPNLESLNLSEVGCRDVMEQKTQHWNLKSLCIEECFFPINVLAKLAHTFPKLSKLCLFLNDDNIGTVFQRFDCLEELTILGSEISDDGLTGGRHHETTGTGCRPFIGDCKNLRALNLYPQPLPGITDASIHHGLLMVSELTSLSLPETAISNKGLRTLLRLQPNLVKLYAKVIIDVSTDEHFLRSTKYQLL